MPDNTLTGFARTAYTTTTTTTKCSKFAHIFEEIKKLSNIFIQIMINCNNNESKSLNPKLFFDK